MPYKYSYRQLQLPSLLLIFFIIFILFLADGIVERDNLCLSYVTLVRSTVVKYFYFSSLVAVCPMNNCRVIMTGVGVIEHHIIGSFRNDPLMLFLMQ